MLGKCFICLKGKGHYTFRKLWKKSIWLIFILNVYFGNDSYKNILFRWLEKKQNLIQTLLFHLIELNLVIYLEKILPSLQNLALAFLYSFLREAFLNLMKRLHAHSTYQSFVIMYIYFLNTLKSLRTEKNQL